MEQLQEQDRTAELVSKLVFLFSYHMKTCLKEICDIVWAIVFIYLKVLFENNLVLQSVLISSNWSGMECEKNPSCIENAYFLMEYRHICCNNTVYH